MHDHDQETRTRTEFQADPVLEEQLSKLAADRGGNPFTYSCLDDEHTSAQWSGLRAYVTRRREKLSRRDVRDALRHFGFHATISEVARLEHGDREPTVRETRTLAAILHVRVGDLLVCPVCEAVAAHPEGLVRRDAFLDENAADADQFRDAVLVLRWTNGLTIRQLARVAGVLPQDVAGVERIGLAALPSSAFVKLSRVLARAQRGEPLVVPPEIAAPPAPEPARVMARPEIVRARPGGLRELREQNGLSLEAAAARAALDVERLRAWERGEVPAELAQLVAYLAPYYECGDGKHDLDLGSLEVWFEIGDLLAEGRAA